MQDYHSMASILPDRQTKIQKNPIKKILSSKKIYFPQEKNLDKTKNLK